MSAAHQRGMTSTSENRIIARRYLSELWSRGILETADELVAPQCELHDPLFGARIGPDGVKTSVSELRDAFPDLAFSLDSFIVEAGDQIALRWFAHGTHRAPLLSLPATGRAFLVSGLMLLRLQAGKLIAITACWEPTSLLEQLGLFDRGFDALIPPERCESPTFAAAGSESELDAGWT